MRVEKVPFYAKRTPPSFGGSYATVKRQLRSVTADLDSSRGRVAELKKENEAKELELGELKAERAMLQTRLR